MTNNKKKKIQISLLCMLIVVALGLTIWLLPSLKQENASDGQVETNINEKINYDRQIKLYDDNKIINPDYIAQITFKSGIIDLPVVQSHLEDTYEAYNQYLRTAWDSMEHDEEGSIFMDPNNDCANDKNIVIYGHYVYPFLDPDQTHKFSPLHLLKDAENYEKNKEIELIFENEIRDYVVAYTYYAEITTTNEGQIADVNYMIPNFEETEFNDYISQVETKQFYDTGIEISKEDHLLTLQTCVKNRDDLRLIVVAKEISRAKMR